MFGWRGARGLAPTGPPFLKYNVIDMVRLLEIETGVPVAAPVDSEGNGEVVVGVLPAGRYATVTHVGHPSELLGVTKALLRLGRRAGPDLGHVGGRRLASGGPAGWRST